MSVPKLPSIPDAGAVINASPSDWRAMLIGVSFLFIAMIVFVIWREILSWRLAKSLDGVKDALTALKIVISEHIATTRATLDEQSRRRK